MNKPKNKQRTITLTNRAPVTIQDDQWPLVASASDQEYQGQHLSQANWVTKWFVGCREHEDGRVIVYATYSHDTQYAGAREYYAKAGRLLDASATQEDCIAAINAVCEDISELEHRDSDAKRWKSLAAQCISDLEPEEL